MTVSRGLVFRRKVLFERILLTILQEYCANNLRLSLINQEYWRLSYIISDTPRLLINYPGLSEGERKKKERKKKKVVPM